MRTGVVWRHARKVFLVPSGMFNIICQKTKLCWNKVLGWIHVDTCWNIAQHAHIISSVLFANLFSQLKTKYILPPGRYSFLFYHHPWCITFGGILGFEKKKSSRRISSRIVSPGAIGRVDVSRILNADRTTKDELVGSISVIFVVKETITDFAWLINISFRSLSYYEYSPNRQQQLFNNYPTHFFPHSFQITFGSGLSLYVYP